MLERERKRKRQAISRKVEDGEAKRRRLENDRQDKAVKLQLEEREAKQSRLEKMRKRKALSQQQEDAEAKQMRLAKDSKRQRVSRQQEDDQTKEFRRRKHRERMALRRANAKEKAKQASEQQASSKQQYLHQGGWKNNLLHQQPWVQREMTSFHEFQQSLQHRQCTVCLEAWPTTVKQQQAEQPKDKEVQYVCGRCQRDRKSPRLFSAANKMHPGPTPPELMGLTEIEQMLISKANPILTVYRKHGGQRGYRGHVLCLNQVSLCDCVFSFHYTVA